jgi:uncharacterized OB-fold protein
MAPERIPIQEGLFTWPAASPQLIAGKCRDCGEITFPRQDSCPACTGRSTEEVLLSRRGTLWTFTVQHFPPPVPFIGPTDRERFEPFGVGYVELPEGIRVEGRLTENQADALEIGMEMELAVEKFVEDDQGRDVMTFAWRPVEGAGERG